jgi:peptidoglycan/LPS O-acetylase OafA/YrhL
VSEGKKGPLTERPAGHVWAVDIIRLLTFSAVICVHCIAYTDNPANPGANAVMMLLQFGREVFFSITGFVLVWSSIGRHVPTLSWWRRRFTFVVVPYLTWTLLYYLVDLIIAPYPSWSWSTLGLDVIDGGAFYHLYFLLISMQLYLVFPLLVRFVRVTAPHAGRWLAAVAALNLAWLGVLQYVPTPQGTASWLWVHAYEILPTYTVYVMAGCYAALYLPQLQQALRDHPRRAMAAAAACVAAAMVGYSTQLGSMSPRAAGNVLQPAMAPACVAAVIVVGLIGTRWSDGPHRGERWIAVGSDISFGVYLVHPLVLTLLLNNGLGTTHQILPEAVCTVLAFAAVMVGATALAWLGRHTPAALPLTGRSRLHRGAAPSLDLVADRSVPAPTA